MESPKPILRRATSIDIDLWRRDSSVFGVTSPEDKGIVSQLYDRTSLLYEGILRSFLRFEPKIHRPVYRRLESGYYGLNTWGSNFNVEIGNLDRTLENSQELRRETISIMVHLCKTLCTGDDDLGYALSRAFPLTARRSARQRISASRRG
jgi:hypothetical protein